MVSERRKRMTKKDYVMIARIINFATDAEHEALVSKDSLVDQLVVSLTEDNPRFDAERFRRACNGGTK